MQWRDYPEACISDIFLPGTYCKGTSKAVGNYVVKSTAYQDRKPLKMKYLFSMLVMVHGLIHLLGFAKAFHFGNIDQLTKEISRPLGIIWLLTGLFFILVSVLDFLKKDEWTVLALFAVVLSQVLIIMFWEDARFGTLANLIIVIVAILTMAGNSFERSYKEQVARSFNRMPNTSGMVTSGDLDHLPPVVKNYLNYVGVVGKPKVNNFKITFEGQMRDKGKDWFSFTSEQYNFIVEPTRLFFMKAKVNGLPAVGYHAYKDAKASMTIKLLSLFPVVKMDPPEMFPTETVTFFNDLCLFAPAGLIDERIHWETIDELRVKASFTSQGTTISAILHFNPEGQLINFVSNDRYAVSEMKRYPFSTPVKDYQKINGLNLPTFGEAVWHYPDGELVYGKFHLKSIEYNVIPPK